MVLPMFISYAAMDGDVEEIEDWVLTDSISSNDLNAPDSVEINQWPRPAWEVLFIIFDRVVVSLAPR